MLVDQPELAAGDANAPNRLIEGQAATVLDENRNTLAARHRRAIERLRELLGAAGDDASREALRHAPHA